MVNYQFELAKIKAINVTLSWGGELVNRDGENIEKRIKITELEKRQLMRHEVFNHSTKLESI